MSSRRTVVLLHATLICAPALFAQNGGTKEVEHEILRLFDQWFKAYINSDADAINRIEGEDLVFIPHLISSPEGMRPQKKADFSRRSEATKAALKKWNRSLSDVHIRVLGDVAVLNAIQTDTGAPRVAGVLKTAHTSVWAKRRGAWQIVNAQWTAIQDKDNADSLTPKP